MPRGDRRRRGSTHARPTAVELYLTNAQADLDNGERAFLSRTTEGWRVSAVGCNRRGPAQDVRWSASSRPEMRAAFVLYLLVIVAILATYLTIGLIAR